MKRVYNLQSKQLVKIFSRIFEANESKMLNDLDQSGDVAATISEFFENSSNVEPAKKCMLYNYIYHSSEIRGLSLVKCSNEIL